MKHTVTISAVLVGCSTLLSGLPAFAWGDLGHSIVGGVAEQTIEPGTRDFIRGILGVEPLAVAAVFPDHVRDDARFGHKELDPTKRSQDNHDFGDYHFCEIPTGYTYDTKPNKDVKDCFGAIEGSIALLKDMSGNTSREEKQLAIRYLVHVMGDIAQPLHVGNGFDLGGNACDVMVQESPQRTPFHSNLHSYWDDTLVTYLGTTYADPTQKISGAKYLGQYLAAFQRVHPEMLTTAAKAQYSQGSVKDWLQDSQSLRENGLYPDAPGSMAGVVKGEEYKNRPYCTWFADQGASIKGPGSQIDKSKIPVLDLAYEQKFAPVVEAQLIKGGLRLAATLDSIAAVAAPKSTPMTDAQQEKILSDVQNAFRGAATPLK
jgi:hypothetical protein